MNSGTATRETTDGRRLVEGVDSPVIRHKLKKLTDEWTQITGGRESVHIPHFTDELKRRDRS